LRGPVESAQYVSLGFGQAARDAGIAISMGSRGDAYDDAVAESFFATLKKELIHRQSWPTRRELSSAVFEYIEAFYNRDRRHSGCAHLPSTSSSSTLRKNKGTDRQRPSSPKVSSKAGEVQRPELVPSV
jgi:putative transposase